MPIVTDNEEEDVYVAEPDPVALEPEYESIAIDTARHDIDDMIVHIEGSAWNVDYYAQVLGPDSEVSPLQLDLDPAYQQYIAAYNMEIKVTQPLDSSMRDETGGMEVTGTATTYPFLIPNQGDMFVADTGDGRKGVFTVTNVDRKTILKETAHEIQYRMVSYLTEEYSDNLKLKTIKETHFRRDFLLAGQNPFLVSSEANMVDKLTEHKRELLGRYIKTFLSSDYSTLLEPDEMKEGLYDHFLTKAFKSCFGVEDHALTREIREMNCDGDDRMNDYTFWDCLLDMDKSMLTLCTKSMKLSRTHRFTHAAVYRGIAYSGIRYMYYPDDERTLEPMEPTSGTPPIIHPPHSGNGYILSSAFYQQGEGQSQLELEVSKAINDQSNSAERLVAIAEDSYQWDEQSQFCYLPILLILLKVAERRL